MVRVKQTPVTRTIQTLPTRRIIFQTLYLLVGARNSSWLICSFELGGKQRASEIFYFAFKFGRNVNNVCPDFWFYSLYACSCYLSIALTISQFKFAVKKSYASWIISGKKRKKQLLRNYNVKFAEYMYTL